MQLTLRDTPACPNKRCQVFRGDISPMGSVCSLLLFAPGSGSGVGTSVHGKTVFGFPWVFFCVALGACQLPSGKWRHFIRFSPHPPRRYGPYLTLSQATENRPNHVTIPRVDSSAFSQQKVPPPQKKNFKKTSVTVISIVYGGECMCRGWRTNFMTLFFPHTG